LVLVAMTMPKIPQRMDTTAPIKKATAVQVPNSVKKIKRTNMMAAKAKQIKYSCLRNSLAPYVNGLLPMKFCSRARGEDFADEH